MTENPAAGESRWLTPSKVMTLSHMSLEVKRFRRLRYSAFSRPSRMPAKNRGNRTSCWPTNE